MVESGIAEDIDYLYGVHLRPAQETNDGRAAPAILHGANAAIIGEITGQEAHAARPHLGTNSIEVVYSILESIKNIHVDPQTPHSVKITKLIAGGKNTNIIPGNANFSIDLRAQTNEVINQLIEKVRGIIQSVGYLYNVNINTSMPSYLPAAQVDSTACNYMKQAIANTIGDQNLDQPLETTGGDDFHYYTIKRPNIKATMLGLGCDLKPGLHHPDMTFNKEVLVKGAQILLNTVLDTLENSSNHTNR